jgi:Transglycosylase SLT domain
VTQAQVTQERAAIEVLIVQHAKTHGLPVELVRFVIRRESNFNQRAVYRGNFGLMQIRLGTARALGYRGDQHGLRRAISGRSVSGRSWRRGARAGALFARLSRCALRPGFLSKTRFVGASLGPWLCGDGDRLNGVSWYSFVVPDVSLAERSGVF